MRNYLLSFLMFISITAAQPAFADVQPGDNAPDFTAKAADGKDITLASQKGQTIVLEWANYECPFSKMHYESGNLPALQETYTGKGVVWLTVMSSAPGKQGYYSLEDAADRSAQMKNHATHVLLDPTGTIGKLYGAKTTPHIYVIDAKGIVQYNGAIDSIPSVDAKTLGEARPLAANAIDAVLAGKKPEMASNQAYGCSIKYAD